MLNLDRYEATVNFANAEILFVNVIIIVYENTLNSVIPNFVTTPI